MPSFLKLFLCGCLYVYVHMLHVSVCVCMSAPDAINNWRVMWCDMATVVGIFNGHGLDIDMHHVN